MIRSAVVMCAVIGALLILSARRASEPDAAASGSPSVAPTAQVASAPPATQTSPQRERSTHKIQSDAAGLQKPARSQWNWSIVYAAGESELISSRRRQTANDELLLNDPEHVQHALGLDDLATLGDAAQDLAELQLGPASSTESGSAAADDVERDTRGPVVLEALEPGTMEPGSLEPDLSLEAAQIELDPNDPLDRWLAEKATDTQSVARKSEGEVKAAAPAESNELSPAKTTPAVREAGPVEPLADEGEAPTAIKPEILALQKKVRQALDIYRPKLLNTRDNDAWEVMHSLIAFGVDTNVNVGRPGGQSANAIGWLCYNGACKGKRLFYLSNQRLQAQRGPGVQGHHGQFLAMLAQSRVMSDYPIKCDNRDFTIRDLIEYEKATCQEKTELTFKLIGLAHYLDLNETWKNDYGQEWTIPKLIQEEIAQPIRGAPCGGTHRLFGLSYAVQRRIRRGEPVEGEYARAEKYVRDYHRYTFSLQNPDGSLSTDWFKGPGNRNDLGRKVQTSGHILEWLVFSLPDNELQDAATTRAINFLASTLIAGRNRTWEIGPQGHALHALLMYDERIQALQQPQDLGEPTDEVAQKAEATPAAEKASPPPAASRPSDDKQTALPQGAKPSATFRR